MLLNKNYIVKIHNLKYLNRGIVFMLDLLLSCIGAFLSLMIMSLLIGNAIYGSVRIIMASTIVLSTLLFLLTGSYKTSIRFSTLRELSKIFGLLAVKDMLMAIVITRIEIFNLEWAVFYAIFDLLMTSFLMISARAFMVSIYYAIVKTGTGNDKNKSNALIYGARGNAPLFATQVNDDPKSSYQVIGYLSPDCKKEGVRIAGHPVYAWNGDLLKLEAITLKQNITHILFTNNADFSHERDRLVDFCIENNIQMLMGGKVHPLDNNKNIPTHIKPIDIEDLLYRDEIKIDITAVSGEMSGKVILVTGAAGSIGSEIARQLAHLDIKHLILLDCAETPLHNIKLELTKTFPNKKISFVLSDVRSKTRIRRVFEQYKPNLVFHAAAYKHVPIVEEYPCEGVSTNIGGTINTAYYAIRNGVEKFIMISTDKAINPTNVMGASKRISELWVQSLNESKSDTQFIITRFGNVLGSNGSVITIFREQISRGGPVTVTHPEVIRYFMTISEACRLVLQAATMGSGGEIYVFDMGKQVKIDNLARRMILLSGLVPDEDISIEYTGLRPGEKLYEELLTQAESTKMTQNEKIRIAQVDDIDAKSLQKDILALMKSATRIDIQQTVRHMKHIIPEFKSNNSVFEIFDTESISTTNNYEKKRPDRDKPGKGINGVYNSQ